MFSLTFIFCDHCSTFGQFPNFSSNHSVTLQNLVSLLTLSFLWPLGHYCWTMVSKFLLWRLELVTCILLFTLKCVAQEYSLVTYTWFTRGSNNYRKTSKILIQDVTWNALCNLYFIKPMYYTQLESFIKWTTILSYLI